jgi:hypothetical protein
MPYRYKQDFDKAYLIKATKFIYEFLGQRSGNQITNLRIYFMVIYKRQQNSLVIICFMLYFLHIVKEGIYEAKL